MRVTGALPGVTAITLGKQGKCSAAVPPSEHCQWGDMYCQPSAMQAHIDPKRAGPPAWQYKVSSISHFDEYVSANFFIAGRSAQRLSHAATAGMKTHVSTDHLSPAGHSMQMCIGEGVLRRAQPRR